MKKFWPLGILTLLYVFIFTSCKMNYYEEMELETTVISCEKGEFNPDVSCQAIANMYLAQGNTAMWSTYMSMANSNGYYSYNITISIEGLNYIIERDEQYQVGDKIIVVKVDTYNENSQLVKTEYK